MTDKDTYVSELPGGYHLFRKPNEVGGHIYYSDEVGGGVHVWDTAVVAESTLLAAIVAEHKRQFEEELKRRAGSEDET